MKVLIKIMAFVVCSIFFLNAFADSTPTEYDIIVISMKNGRVNEDGTVTYNDVTVRINTQERSLRVYCSEPGDKTCPATVTVLSTIVTGVSTNSHHLTAIDIIKGRIAEGYPNGNMVHNGMLYQWSNGVIHNDYTYEMEMIGIPYPIRP